MSGDTHVSVWMPLYIGDYLKDTGRLSTVVHGAYLLLIMDYWTSGRLEDDDEQLARVARLSVEKWRKIKPKITSFFALAEGQYIHPRIEQELHKAKKNALDAKVKASKAAAARWKDHSKQK